MTIICVEADAEESDEGEESNKSEVRHDRVHRPLPTEMLAKVEAAILAGNECEIRTAVDAAKEHWGVNGRYLSQAEHKLLNMYEKRADKAEQIASNEEQSAWPGRHVASAAAFSQKLARLQAEYNVAETRAAAEDEAWTLLEMTDWVELDEVWLELASDS